MNFLAHLYLSDDNPESRLGNLMADFVKGAAAVESYGPAIVTAITRHRVVDKFTDTHDLVVASKRLISDRRRRFSGIIVDVCYDHFLARNWETYSSIELPVFAQEMYATFRNYSGELPISMRKMLRHMIEQDWLVAYGTSAGIARALDGISLRIKRANTLTGGVEELERNYDVMGAHFHEFFPDLIQHIREQDRESPICLHRR